MPRWADPAFLREGRAGLLEPQTRLGCLGASESQTGAPFYL